MRHGNCRQIDNGFDSDLCTCGCAAVEAFVTKAEIATFMQGADSEAEIREAQTNVRALAHARATNARGGVGVRQIELPPVIAEWRRHLAAKWAARRFVNTWLAFKAEADSITDAEAESIMAGAR